jgi:hypothetical protein
VSELVSFSGDAQSQLVAWADAARAASGLATSLVQTNVCPPAFRGKPQEATAVILLGAELGLSPIASLRSMFEIRGVLGMYVRAQLALVQSRGHRIWTVAESDDAVTVQGHRAGDPEHIEETTWTIARARQAGFIRRGARNEPSQYELQPRAMLWARAVGEIARRIAADVLAGVPELDDPTEPRQAATGGTSGAGTVVQRRQPAPPPEPRQLVEPPPADVTELVELDEPSAAAGGSPPPQESHRTDDEPSSTLPVAEPPDEPDPDVEPLLTQAQLTKLQVLFVKAAIRGPDARHAFLTRWLGRPITSTNELTVTEASSMIDQLEALDTKGGTS